MLVQVTRVRSLSLTQLGGLTVGIPYVQIDREEFIFPEYARRAVRDAETEDSSYNDHALARIVTGATVVTFRASTVHPASLDHWYRANADVSDAALRMVGSRKRTAPEGFDPSFEDDDEDY